MPAPPVDATPDLARTLNGRLAQARQAADRLARLLWLMPLAAVVAFTLVSLAPVDPIEAYVGARTALVGAEQRAQIVAENRRSTDALIRRFEDLGFNAVRFWAGFTGDSAYTVGDGSEMDNVDHFIAQATMSSMRRCS